MGAPLEPGVLREPSPSVSTMAGSVALFGFPISIGTRLGVAFIAVAVLAIVANYCARGGGGKTLVHTEVATVPIRPTAAAVPPVVKYRSAEEIIASLNRYSHAVLSKADHPTPEADAELRAALTDLDRDGSEYWPDAAKWMAGEKLEQLQARVAAQKTLAGKLQHLAGERRVTLKKYWNLFETLDGRLKTSLDQGWKIFGRIFARRSLIELSRGLEQIRQAFGSSATAGAYESADDALIAAKEAAFAEALQQNEPGLRRSQGAEWVAQLSTDFEKLKSMRASIVRLDSRHRRSVQAFYNETTNLISALQSAPPVRLPAPEKLRASKTSTTSISTATPEHDYTMLAVTASVLLLLFVISIGTILSVHIPVRRLMRATRRIANGETRIRVPRGGIRELDELAAAFNSMAEQLAAAQSEARAHQRLLQAQLVQRTRQLQSLTEHDPLTGLANRRQLLAQLEEVLIRAGERDQRVAVFCISLDNFKAIIDSMGHELGDHVLQRAGNRLRHAAGVHGLTARLDGDEFAVLCEDAVDVRQAHLLGAKLVRAFDDPITVGGCERLMTVSVGVAMYPDHARDAQALLKAANSALFRAKETAAQSPIFSMRLDRTRLQ